MTYLILIVVLIQVALGIPILLTSIRKKEQHFYGILMSRGMGKRGVLRFMFAELFVIYLFSILGGFLLGLAGYAITLLVGLKTNPYSVGIGFRMFINPVDIVVILASAIGISMVIMLVGFFFDTRKSISEYLYKF
jgi:ABC-type antimicrobial peptide transport system permease subunit